MSAGLFGLLDDVAALARLAAASVDDIGAAAGRATAKAAGVVIDDTAVTPQYVQGISASRELPMIKRIAIGSLRNKLVFILPAALVLSIFLPEALPWLLMAGATFLCFEGAEKVWGWITGHDAHAAPTAVTGEDAEKAMTSGAIRTDFILSAEIMVIALNEVAAQTFWLRLASLVVVAIVITAAVYGVVALIVKMDDAGLALAQRTSTFAQKFGRGLVAGMPKVLSSLSIIGTIAMLWVGGHILLAQSYEAGLRPPYELVHDAEHWVSHAVGFAEGGVAWLVNTGISAVVGLVIGAIVALIVHLLPFGKKHEHPEPAAANPEPSAGAEVQGETKQ